MLHLIETHVNTSILAETEAVHQHRTSALNQHSYGNACVCVSFCLSFCRSVHVCVLRRLSGATTITTATNPDNATLPMPGEVPHTKGQPALVNVNVNDPPLVGNTPSPCAAPYGNTNRWLLNSGADHGDDNTSCMGIRKKLFANRGQDESRTMSRTNPAD